MKIIELRAENIKRLVAVTIKPDGNMVEITGRNGHGKTSVRLLDRAQNDGDRHGRHDYSYAVWMKFQFKAAQRAADLDQQGAEALAMLMAKEPERGSAAS